MILNRLLSVLSGGYTKKVINKKIVCLIFISTFV